MNAKWLLLWGFVLTMSANHSFAQWTQVGSLPPYNLNCVAINSSGDIFVGTYDGGGYRSTNGGNGWVYVIDQSNYNVYEVYCLAFAPSGNVFAGTYMEGLLRSTDNGHAWGFVSGPPGDLPEEDVYAVAVSASGTVFAADYGDIYRSTDGGITWTQAKHSSNEGGGNAGFTSIAFGGGDTVYICGASDYFYSSTDNGSTWHSSVSGLTKAPYVLAVNSKGTVFAGTNGGGVFKSTDGGSHWTAVNTNLTNSYIKAIAVNRADFVYVGTSTGVFVSLDNGGNWTADTSGLAHPDIRSIAFDTMGHVYVGAYSSSDNGGLWRSNAGLPIELTSFTAQETGGAVVLQWSTLSEVNNYGFMVERSAEPTSDFLPVSGLIPGHGTTIVPHSYTFTDNPPPAANAFYYRLESIDLNSTLHYSDAVQAEITGVAERSADFPAHVSLGQNYPNPFNPSTTIQFTIVSAQSGSASGGNRQLTIVKVFDVLGREVATLVNEVKEPGTYTVQFSGSGLASGLYFYRLSAGQYVECRKMVVMK
jgi:hypothetical protein